MVSDVLGVSVGSLYLRTPVLLASGTAGWGLEYKGLIDFDCVGGLITKAITLFPRRGNPPPRIVETPCGLLNSIGLENPGVEAFLETLPKVKTLGVKIIANIAGFSENEFVKLAEKLSCVDALELNVSCPNVKQGGIAWITDLPLMARMLQKVRKVTSLPIIVKLSPEGDVEAQAKVVEDSGGDAISLVNTFRGMSVDIDTLKPRLGSAYGGLSGPAIKPLALYRVWRVAQSVSIPVIGVGGITSAEDAIEFLAVGAKAVEVGTALFRDPGVVKKIVVGIKEYLISHQYSNINKFFEAVHKEVTLWS